jgi:hypothetical protein
MNSIQRGITPSTVANQIRMERQAKPTCAIVAVEGGTDRRLLAKFSVAERCRFVVANGKFNVVEAVKILDQEDIGGILGVVDNDFDRLLGQKESSPNIVDSFLHDIEIVMFTSSALDHLMAERADPARFPFPGIEDFRRFLLERTKPLSYLRLLSLREPYNLDFDGLKFRFIESQLRIDEPRLIEIMVSRTKNCCVSRSDLLKALQRELSSDYDLYQVSCGHDVIEMLWFGLRTMFGRASSQNVDPETLESELRIAFSQSDFVRTALFAGLTKWEQTNSRFTFLRKIVPS